jgi:hypothetical protein
MLGIHEDESDLDINYDEAKIDSPEERLRQRAAVAVLTGRENKLVIISNRCANPSNDRH